ncbi:CGNR zinc finger domain-containing protein [Streptomyces sp. NPDC059949]|uniref:CGNR zinc finger domain-containing protein n=1 Tax=Streptomyces sp. NPDC059949 TaxID=3347013 RepID=UPI0036535F9B
MTPAPAPAPDRLAFPFIGGRPCLDFAATLGKRHTDAFERLTDPGALGRWIGEAGLRTDRPQAVHVTGAELVSARELRESLYRVLTAAMDGRAPAPHDLVRVNEAAAHPDLAPQLDFADGGGRAGLRLQGGPVRHDVRAALATVARDAVQLVGGPLLARVKECENPECSLLFLDDSQARRRRWCSMDRCGNLAKIAGYRSRARGGS